MTLTFIFPLALWLLALLAPLWGLALVGPRRLRPWRFWSSLALRTTIMSALILALAGAQIARPAEATTTVFLVDRSASITPDEQARAEAFVRAALAQMPPTDQAALVTFGADALVERPPASVRSFDQFSTLPTAAGTDIQAALQLGLALLPADANRRIVLLSDGGENAGDARAAGMLAAAQGVPISYVDLGAPGADEALMTGLSAPANLRQGQNFELTASVESSVAQTARLRVFGDDQPLFDQEVQLQAGANRFSVPVEQPAAGFRRYHAQIEPLIDALPQNNRAEALVRVAGLARVLLVEGDPGAAQNLRDALIAARMEPVVVTPQALPADLMQLSAYDAVALINVPARALPVEAMANLPVYVRDLGRGLIMVGGSQSFGLGGYGRTPLEEALPVAMDVPEQIERPNLAIVYVLDKSASMDACHCAGPSRDTDGGFGGPRKIDLGKDAVAQSVAVLNERDTVGVITFDEQANWVFPPQQGPAAEEVYAAIAAIGPEGPTSVRAGLQSAAEMLAQVDAGVKHVILLTDGWSQDGNEPLDIARSMRNAGVTLSVIAEGMGSAPYLQQLAAVGGGRFFPTERLEDIPQIFLQETTRVATNYLVETPFVPTIGASSPILKDIAEELPPLYGYNGTTLKATATQALGGIEDSPVLAQWQYGLGRAVAWTSDARDHWARDWVRWTDFPRFAAQMVAWALPSGATGQFAVALQPAGARTTLDVAAQDERGQPRADLALRAVLVGANGLEQPIPLTQVAPGSYRAVLDTPPQGAYLVRITEMQGDRIIAQETTTLAAPYSPEYRPAQHNPALLAGLAQVSGGTSLAQPADVFAHHPRNAGHTRELGLALLLLALVLLPIDIVVRRLFASNAQSSRFQNWTK